MSGILHGALTAGTALGTGLACGALNIWVLTAAGRRLADSANSKLFVISSLFRVAAFGIVAGVFAAIGPWWSMVLYLVGLFTPFAFHAARAWRDTSKS